MERTFSDGIGSIAVGDHVVRIDFVSLSATEKDAEGNPIAVFRRRMIIPIQGFLKLYHHFEQTYIQMQNAGYLPKDDGPAPQDDVSDSGRSPQLMMKPEVTSPNF